MTILMRILRHTFRFPVQSGLSLLMAVACTVLVLVLPGITMQFIDVIIAKKRPDLIIPTAAIGIGAILVRQLLFMTVGQAFSQNSSCHPATAPVEVVHEQEGAMAGGVAEFRKETGVLPCDFPSGGPAVRVRR